MSKKVTDAIAGCFPQAVISTHTFRGDDVAVVLPSAWRPVASFLKSAADLQMDQFIDLTAVDYPEREPELPRFDVVLVVRSFSKNFRVVLKTRVGDGEELESLTSVWIGTNWAEREVFDMFGIRFRGHPDLRRILLYDEFEGYPLRKDYPIDRTQPLVPYREVEGTHKLPPFGLDEGQPFSRIEWQKRLRGSELQVSPALAVQQGEKRSISESSENIERDESVALLEE